MAPGFLFIFKLLKGTEKHGHFSMFLDDIRICSKFVFQDRVGTGKRCKKQVLIIKPSWYQGSERHVQFL